MEEGLKPYLQQVANEFCLYLDSKGPRPARSGKKVSWEDRYGNKHDLDFVLEKDGSPHRIGVPVAFIETAYRRYTKHSRNKAQEIQGAIQPLVETYRHLAPFTGVVLAGDFTEGAIQQLRSLGFEVVYIPHECVLQAFRVVGIDAFWDEGTPDDTVQAKLEQWELLIPEEKAKVARHLYQTRQEELDRFLRSLRNTLGRRVSRVIVIPLHGRAVECGSVTEAVEFVLGYADHPIDPLPVIRYEIIVQFNNGNEVIGKFGDRQSAVEFLRSYEAVD